MFESECPSCNGKISEKTEALLLAARIKNISDTLSTADLYEKPLDKLRKLNEVLTDIL